MIALVCYYWLTAAGWAGTADSHPACSLAWPGYYVAVADVIGAEYAERAREAQMSARAAAVLMTTASFCGCATATYSIRERDSVRFYAWPCFGVTYMGHVQGLCRLMPSADRMWLTVAGDYEVAGACPEIIVTWPDGHRSVTKSSCDADARHGFSTGEHPLQSGRLVDLSRGAIEVEIIGMGKPVRKRLEVEQLVLMDEQGRQPQ